MSIRPAVDPGASPVDPLERLPVVILSLLTTLGAVLWWIPLHGVTPLNANGYGLISVLPLPTILGAFVMVLTFVATLSLRRAAPWLLGAQIVVTVVSLHTLAQVMEPVARFPTAWQHAGFIEYITRTGEIGTNLDARFSWAAFFGLIGFLMKAVGVNDIDPILRWAPLVMQLLYLLPLAMIVRVMKANWRAKWFAVWLFPVANWVGQDYLAPQAFGYLIYLFFLAILLTWFRPEVLRTRKAGKRGSGPNAGRFYTFFFGPKEPGEDPVRLVGRWERSILVLLLVALLLVGTAAHQLTPYLLIASAGALVLVGRCELRGIPILGGVIYLGFISFMAYGYWRIGAGETLFAGGGDPLGAIMQSTAGRIGYGDEALEVIAKSRIYLVLIVMALTLVGLIRRRARGIDDRVAFVLLVIPVTSFGLQSYGGEIALRTYLFMLPGAVFLAAYAFYPDPKPVPVVKTGPFSQTLRRWVPKLVAATFATILMGGFLLVRYGNEAFEQVRPGEIKAFSAMVDDAGEQPITVVWVSGEIVTIKEASSEYPQAPWSHERFDLFQYRRAEFAQEPFKSQLLQKPPAKPAKEALLKRQPKVEEITSAMQAPGKVYLYMGRINDTYQTLNFGLAPDWGDKLRRDIRASGQYTQVFADPDAAVFKLTNPPKDLGEPNKLEVQALVLGLSPWTPAGLVYLPVLIGVLTARELKRLTLKPGEYRRLRPYSVVAFPLLLGLLIIIFERFAKLGDFNVAQMLIDRIL